MPEIYTKTDVSGVIDGRQSEAFAYVFKNIDDMVSFTDTTFEEIKNTPTARTAQRIIRPWDIDLLRSVQFNIRNRNWFGTTDISLVMGPINTFLRSQDLERTIESFRNRIARVDVIDIDQHKKIEFTDVDKGIFSFDLASIGLVRVYDYFSPLLQHVVDANLVESYQTGSGDRVFYFVGRPFIPRHEVTFKGIGFYSKILGRNVEKSMLDIEEVNGDILYFYPEQEAIPRHDVVRQQKVSGSGQKKFATTWKKSFIHIPKVEGRLPRIDLIIPVAYPVDTTTDQMYWNCISIIAIAEKLVQSNVNFRIVMSRSGHCVDNQNRRIYGFVTLKDEQERLDTNRLALTLSDGRTYRISFFRAMLAMQYKAGFEDFMDNGIVTPIGRPAIPEQVAEIKEQYIKVLSKSTSQVDRDAATRPETKIIIPTAYTQQQAEDSFTDVITQIAQRRTP